MSNAIWTQTYQVNTIVLDHQKRLSFVGLLNILQDVAWIHAKSAGWGFEDLIEKGTIWVLARQKVVMTEWPKWEDVVTIRTWGRKTVGLIALREFEILVGERKVGECTTSWLVLDWNTRRPQKLDRISFDLICREDGLSIEAQKIAPRSDLTTATTVEVRHSDLDVNAHVNNTRYAQWVLDALSAEELATTEIAEYEVNFLSETGVGDMVAIECDGAVSDADGLIRRHYQGRKTGEDKPAFTARLVLKPRA